MRLSPAKGTALRQHRLMVRFATGAKPGPRQDHKLASRIIDVRKLLRTDLSLDEIAEQLGVAKCTLRSFIKRRNLCDVKERAYFISLQASIKTLEAAQ